MIVAYNRDKIGEPQETNAADLSLLNDAIWLDMINPTLAEENQVEQLLTLNVPTWDEMREIELSSRLYKDGDALFMTATMIAQSDSFEPKQDAVTFVLTKQKLITIRYIDPQAFKSFINRLHKTNPIFDSPDVLLLELLETTVDRLADILEIVSHRLESYSKTVFQVDAEQKLNYSELMQQIGRNADLNSKIGESLVTFSRLVMFFGQSNDFDKNKGNQAARLTMMRKDITALSDHADFLSGKLTFLLDATLGMIQIEQNAIIKIFSVAAVIFLPPTLIASIYGMNFQFMPELSWKFGYIIAIGLMIFSSWLPYKYFKHRKWL